MQNGQQNAYQQQVGGIEAQVQQFAEAKDESGNPAHPYFGEVYEDMVGLAQQRPGVGLDQLYDAAIWGNPGVRAKVLAAQNHTADQERKRKDAEAVAKAKRGGVSVSGAGTTVPNGASDDIDDILNELVPTTGW